MDGFQSFSLNNTKTVWYFEEQNRKWQINQNPTYFVFAKDFAIASYYKNRAIFLYSKKKLFCFQETSDVQKVQFTFIKYVSWTISI